MRDLKSCATPLNIQARPHPKHYSNPLILRHIRRPNTPVPDRLKNIGRFLASASPIFATNPPWEQCHCPPLTIQSRWTLPRRHPRLYRTPTAVSMYPCLWHWLQTLPGTTPSSRQSRSRPLCWFLRYCLRRSHLSLNSPRVGSCLIQPPVLASARARRTVNKLLQKQTSTLRLKPMLPVRLQASRALSTAMATCHRCLIARYPGTIYKSSWFVPAACNSAG